MSGFEGKGRYGNNISKSVKKYELNCNASPNEVFNMPFLSDNKTISYIKNHGRIMFLIRGPPYTMKTKLSDLLKEKYPDAVYCSAVKHIDKYTCNGKIAVDKKKKIKTHTICQTLVENACRDNKLIIVQNSHMRKFELKPYLDMAVLYNYTVIMAITTYKFDITFEALQEAEKNRNGSLGLQYLNYFSQTWEDVQPLYMGWFVSLEDSECIQHFTLQILETLSQNQQVQTHLVSNDIANYFHPRKILSCLAGYTENEVAMKKYYLSYLVQLSYGKCFDITIVGYLVTKTDIIGIVNLSSEMKSLLLYDLNQASDKFTKHISSNVTKYRKTKDFDSKKNLKPGQISEDPWSEGEEINISRCSFMHLAQKSFDVFNLQELRKVFNESFQIVTDTNGIIHNEYYVLLDDGKTKFCKIKDDVWLVKTPQKIITKAIFTGFYSD